MKNKNKVTRIKEIFLIVLFCILIIVPNIAYKFVSEEYKKNSENRTLSTKPILNIDNFLEYPSLYEEYYNDNLPFKDVLVRFNSLVKFKIFNKSSADSVIKGEDNWLFYDSKYKDDGDTIADYQGTNKYTEEELQEIAEALTSKKEFLDEKGIEFYVYIAPNKSQIYSEYMPKEIIKNKGESKADELVEYLREKTEVNVVYPKEELLKNKGEYYLYNKIDTHWNFIGGYIGAVELMKSMDPNYEYKSLDNSKIISKEITSGDLASMMNLDGKIGDIYYEIKDFKTDIMVDLIEDKGKAMNRFKSSNENGKKLLAYRDSFAIKMIPYLYKEFEESAFVWGEPFNEEQIDEEKPDVVLLEVVERATDKLKR